MKTIIFDFDGTIADSLELVIEIYRQLTGDNRKLTVSEREALRKLPAQRVMKTLGVSVWRLPFLVRKGRKIMHSRLDEVAVFEGLPDVLRTLQERGYTMRIVTSNSAKNVEFFLDKHALNSYFTDIVGNAGLFGKARVLRRIVTSEKLDLAQTYYVGDEARDITASKKAKLPIVAVGWGYNHTTLLQDLEPYALAEKPSDLLKIFPEFST